MLFLGDLHTVLNENVNELTAILAAKLINYFTEIFGKLIYFALGDLESCASKRKFTLELKTLALTGLVALSCISNKRLHGSVECLGCCSVRLRAEVDCIDRLYGLINEITVLSKAISSAIEAL